MSMPDHDPTCHIACQRYAKVTMVQKLTSKEAVSRP